MLTLGLDRNEDPQLTLRILPKPLAVAGAHEGGREGPAHMAALSALGGRRFMASGDMDEESSSLGVMGLERRVLDVRSRLGSYRSRRTVP